MKWVKEPGYWALACAVLCAAGDWLCGADEPYSRMTLPAAVNVLLIGVFLGCPALGVWALFSGRVASRICGGLALLLWLRLLFWTSAFS